MIIAGHRRISIRRSNSIGDVVAATVVADELFRMGYDVEFQANPILHPLLRLHPKLRLITAPTGNAIVNLDGAYETHPNRCSLHFNDMYREKANKDLVRFGVIMPTTNNWTSRLVCKKDERSLAYLSRHPKPWIAIFPRSNSWAHRTVPDIVWEAAARDIPGTKFWLGNHGPAPAGLVDGKCRSISHIANWASHVDLVVSVDSGPLHISAAVGAPLVAILQNSSPELHLTNQRDFAVVSARLDCLNCQMEACPINAGTPPCQNVPHEVISDAVNLRLSSISGDSVAAIIAVYKPDITKLNRCIDHVLPQVSEIVVCGDLDTPWPIAGIRSDPRIRCVRRPQHTTGYGKKATFGARHSNSAFLHFLNDDVYLNPNVIQTLRQAMTPDVGIVTHTLRYLDGTIQYAGKTRPSGACGFGHIDLRATRSRYHGLVEQESACGASMLIRRRVFFDAGGFDERFVLYSEDDDLAMKVRQNGWKVVLTTEVEGTHEEHASTSITPRWAAIMHESSRIFASKWQSYFKANPNPNVIGRFS